MGSEYSEQEIREVGSCWQKSGYQEYREKWVGNKYESLAKLPFTSQEYRAKN